MAKQFKLPQATPKKFELPDLTASIPAPKLDLGQAYLSNPALNAIQNLIVPAANVVESALPIVGSQKPKYTTPDIESMRSDMENTNRMLEDVAKRRDMDDQTKNTIFQRLENRRKEQYKNFVQASGESLPYEPFTEYLAKRGIPVAVMDILMAPQRIGTAVGQGIVAGAGGLKDVITGKGEGFNKRYQDLAKQRPEVLYMNPSQLLNMANKYGEGENLLKPGESWQDMLRREREETNALEAEQGAFSPLLEKSYMGKDYKTIETPEMIKTTAGVTGFVLDAILDPSNLLPGIGVGVSTGKAISRSVLRRGISGATDLDELIKAAQKASVNGMSRKEIETLFKSRASKIAPKLEEIMMETPQQQVRVDLTKEPLPLKPEEIIAGEALPPTRVTLTKEQLPVTPETPVGEAGMAGAGVTPNVPIKPSFVPEPSIYPLNPEDFRRYQEDLMFSEDEALRARIEEAIFGKQPSKPVVEGVPTEVAPENIVNKLNSLADISVEKDPYKLFGTKVKVKNDYGEIFEGTIHSINKSSGGDIVYDINIPALRHGERDTARFPSKNILEVNEIKTEGMNPIKVLEEIQKMPMVNFKTITVPNEIIDFLPESSQIIQELIHQGVKYFYKKDLKPVARYDSKVFFGDKFISLPKGAKEHILYHEIGHEVSDRFLEEWGKKGLKLTPIFGENKIASNKKSYFDGIAGTYNLGESIAEAYAIYRTEPAWLKSKHPEAYKVLDEVLSGKDFKEAVESVKTRTPVVDEVVEPVAPVVENVGQIPPETPVPEIKPEIPAPVSVLDEAVEPITPTAPVEPVTDSITPPVETIQQAVTPEASQIPAEIPMQGVTPSVFADVSSSVVVKKTPKDFNAREMVVAKIPTTAGERNMVGIISDEGVFKPILSADREFYRSHRRKYGIKEIKWESMGKKFDLESARLWEYSQEEFFDIEGGLPFKVDRRKIIKDALIAGEDVPNNVLEDFPSLAREYGYTVEGVPNDYYQYEKTTKNGNKILISGDPEKAAETAKDLGIKYKKGEIGIIVDSEDADIFKRETRIKIKKPASVSVPDEAVGTIPPTTPAEAITAQSTGQVAQGVEGLAKETPKIPIVNEQGFVEAHAGVNVVEPIIKLGMEYIKTATPADNLITRSPGFDKFITFLNNLFPNRGVGDAFLKALNLGQEKTYRNVRRGVFLAEQYAKQDIELMWNNLRDIAHDKAKKSVVDFIEPFEDIWSKGLPPEKAKAVVDLMEKTGEYTGLLRGVADEENITSKEFMILSNIVSRENREIEKNIAKSGAKSTITPTDPAYWQQKGYSPDDMAKINNMGILKESDYGVNNIPEMGYSLSKKGRDIALIIKTTKNPEKILKSRYNIPEDRIDLVKNIIDEMVRFDKPQVSFNPTRMKREIVRSEEVDNLVAKGMLEESLGKRVGKKFQPSYALTEKGRAVWDTVDKTPLNALAVFDSPEVYKKAVAKTGIKTEEEMMELARKFSNWYQQMIQEVPLSEGQIRKVKTMWNRYYPRERATLSIDGLKKIMYNPKYYTPEEVKMAENIYLSAKDSRKELQTITQQKAEMKDIFKQNITTADDPEAFKVPKKLLAKADMADDAEIYLTQEGKSLAIRKSIEMWAFNRAMRNRGGLLTPKRVGVTGIDTVNFMNRNLTADYDAVLPYIKNPVDVLETTMKRVANAVRTTEFFDEIKKIPEYVRTDLDPARVGERYVDPQTSLVYKYIKPEQTEYMNLAGTYINENVLHSIQTQQQGLSMGRYLISNAWDRFARPVWYSMMTVNRLGYHAMNILSSGVNMLLANPTLPFRPRSAWNTFTKWFKVLGSRAERMKYADDIRDLLEHEIIGAENLSSSGKSYLGTIPGVDAVVFDMPAILNKGGLTISEMLEKLPELANQSDALARIVYYEERKKELQGIMKKPEYKKLSAEEQEAFVKEFKANIADEAKTIIPSYIDTLPALKSVNEVMPLTSWGIKAMKIPYRNLLTLLGKNDLKGFNALTKKINMTNKAKAALTLFGIPALAGVNAYVQYANNPDEAMSTAAAMPEWKNNFYDQGEGSINFLEKMAGNQDNYLAMKYVLDAIANRSFTFNTGKGRITVSGAAYGEKYRIPSVVNPIFTVADAVRGVNVNSFSKTGEPISTSPDTLGQLRDTLAWMWVQSSPDMKRWQNEVRKLQKKKIPEKDAQIMAAWKLVDPEAIFRYDKVERSNLEGKIKGLGYKITNKKKEYNKAVGNPEKQQQILEEVKALRSKQAGYTRLLPNLPVDDETGGSRR